MIVKHRFYLAPEDWDSDSLVLRDEEAHHCRDVMRCREGDRVAIFDGCGRVAEVTITGISKRAVELQGESSEVSEPLPARITLAQAVPKGKNMELIIQKATELGAARIVPLLSTNTVIRLDEKEREKKRSKWQRVAVEACKQCGQNWLPRVDLPADVESFVRESDAPFRVIAAIAPESLPLKEILAKRREEESANPDAVSLLIGPEGDFTREEVDCALAGGFVPMSLGPIILRSETAAIYSLSVLVYELMDR